MKFRTPPPPLIIFILLINWGIKTNGMKKRDGGKTASTPEMFSFSTGKKNPFHKVKCYKYPVKKLFLYKSSFGLQTTLCDHSKHFLFRQKR